MYVRGATVLSKTMDNVQMMLNQFTPFPPEGNSRPAAAPVELQKSFIHEAKAVAASSESLMYSVIWEDF